MSISGFSLLCLLPLPVKFPHAHVHGPDVPLECVCVHKEVVAACTADAAITQKQKVGPLKVVFEAAERPEWLKGVNIYKETRREAQSKVYDTLLHSKHMQFSARLTFGSNGGRNSF